MTVSLDMMSMDGIGAGNFFRYAFAFCDSNESSVIELDKAYDHPDGRSLREISLTQLDMVTDRVAAGFYEAGIRPRDPVAVFLEEGFRYTVHYIALNKLGAIPVFLNGALPLEVAARFISDVGAVAVVTDRGLDTTAVGVPVFQTDPFSEAGYPVFRHSDDDPVLISHTSGTTGVPKAVPFRHRAFFYGIRQQVNAEWAGRIVHALPQSHASSISFLMSCVARNSRVLMATERRGEQLARRIEAWRPGMVAAFPSVYVNLCELDLGHYDFTSVSRWLSTGDASHERHVRKLVALGTHRNRDGNLVPGSLFIDNFGSSELGFAMFRQVHTTNSGRYGRCIGRPFDWVDAQILTDSDELAPDGVVGRLALRAPTVTSGYWNAPALTAEHRVRGYWLSGDYAYRDADGRFYHVDRMTDAIATGSGTLYSCQIEELLLREVPGLSDCSLVSTGMNADGSPQLVLAVIPRPDTSAEDLPAAIDSALTRNGFPSVQQLMVTEPDRHTGITGKALKRRLREDACRQLTAA
jgi:acyl-CoA synthetase (AMP-forming)/AMP-acid ligase II